MCKYLIKIYNKNRIVAGKIQESDTRFLPYFTVYKIKVLFNTHFEDSNRGDFVEIADENHHGIRVLKFNNYNDFIKRLRLEIL